MLVGQQYNDMTSAWLVSCSPSWFVWNISHRRKQLQPCAKMKEKDGLPPWPLMHLCILRSPWIGAAFLNQWVSHELKRRIDSSRLKKFTVFLNQSLPWLISRPLKRYVSYGCLLGHSWNQDGSFFNVLFVSAASVAFSDVPFFLFFFTYSNCLCKTIDELITKVLHLGC